MWKPRSLVSRVVLSVSLGALFSATAVAVVTVVLSSHLSHIREDADLHGVAGMLAYALLVKRFEPALAASDQTQEHAHSGISVAIFEQTRFVAGDATIPFVTAGACASNSHTRACAVPAERWVAIAARERVLLNEQEQVSTLAASLAVLLASLFSTCIALALAYAAVKPIDDLARVVQNLPASAPSEVSFGPDVGVKEVDALRATLQSAFEQQARALAHSRSFAGHAAHQLRDPLTTIIGELDRACDLGGDDGRDEKQRARRVALRLSALVGRLLILASPHDRLATVTEMSLRDGVEDAIETLPEAARRRIRSEGAPIEIRTDPALLVSAIVSALENALKYSSGLVRIRIEPGDRFVLLAIEDDGPGVTVHEREQVFAPFHRGKEGRTGHIPGHGIGLAVIARVAAAHGGTARFVEQPTGARLEMTFALPDDSDPRPRA